MSMPGNRINELIDKLLHDECTMDERQELFSLVEKTGDDQLHRTLEDAWNRYDRPLHSVGTDTTTEILHSILEKNNAAVIHPAQVVPFWYRIVAASVILLLGLGTYFLFRNRDKQKTTSEIAKTSAYPEIKAPKTNRATITLPDGRKVLLDSAANGTLATQGKVKLVKLANGQIVYTGTDQETIFNTLSNPRGSKAIDMTLSDGSGVWLNAGSSITYPVAFSGRERKVTIDGEAYFEVRHDEKMPFIVSKGKIEILVLGTHFNINAYDEEETLKVTLLEGSVKVRDGKGTVLLSPGQQAAAYVEADGKKKIKVADDADLDQVMAWKNGLFNFGNMNIREIMREAARWYDIEVDYKGNIEEDRYKGKISRDSELSELLKVLEMYDLRFSSNGKKITISSG